MLFKISKLPIAVSSRAKFAKVASTLGLFAQVAVEAYTTPEEELRQREAQRNNQPLIGKDLSPPDEKPSLNDYKSLLL